jgi:23S rRNA (cytidine1920-2'-O)/16S rRNA (cytidine1409-2'-O)-methyltransferase
MSGKIRLDVLLVERGLAESREQARRLILGGKVRGPSSLLDKPGLMMDPEAEFSVAEPEHPYVSRGGLKLAGALDRWRIDPSGIVCADFGSSTGGFTDCLLQRGATRVYAFDLGKGQLHWRLRNDARVVVREGVNVRGLSAEDLPEWVDLVVIDLAFISLIKVLSSARAIMKPSGPILALVKPQFEAGKGKVGKKGVIRRSEDRLEVLRNHVAMVQDHGLFCVDLMLSPIEGAEGNIEYLSLLVVPGEAAMWRERLGLPGEGYPDEARLAVLSQGRGEEIS